MKKTFEVIVQKPVLLAKKVRIEIECDPTLDDREHTDMATERVNQILGGGEGAEYQVVHDAFDKAIDEIHDVLGWSLDDGTVSLGFPLDDYIEIGDDELWSPLVEEVQDVPS